MVDHFQDEDHCSRVSQSGGARQCPTPNRESPRRTKSPQGAHGATRRPLSSEQSPHANNGGQAKIDAQSFSAPLIDEAGHSTTDTQTADARFVDPLIQQIVEQWRQRQDMVRAMTRLTNQGKSILRRLINDDDLKAQKRKASALFDRVAKAQCLTIRLAGLDPRKVKAIAKVTAALKDAEADPLYIPAAIIVGPLLLALKPLDDYRKPLEKRLAAMAEGLPIAHMVEEIHGFGYLGLAGIVAECGDLSDYKSVSAVWKRCGLAVIDGGRQRKKCGDAAFEQGYSPQRRSVLWVLQDPLFQAQSRGVNNGAQVGPYRVAYDRYKALQLEKIVEYSIKGTNKTEMLPMKAGHAHNRALRKMVKDLLRDLTIAWRADRANQQSGTRGLTPGPQSSTMYAAQ